MFFIQEEDEGDKIYLMSEREDDDHRSLHVTEMIKSISALCSYFEMDSAYKRLLRNWSNKGKWQANIEERDVSE